MFAFPDDVKGDTGAALPTALLHGDAFLDNVIVGPDGLLKGRSFPPLMIIVGRAAEKWHLCPARFYSKEGSTRSVCTWYLSPLMYVTA